MIKRFEGSIPRLAEDVFVADTALVMGDVTIGPGSSVWYGTVIRGDVHRIVIGAGTNIQDGSVVHVTREQHSTTVGDRVTVGHGAIIHGCTIGDRCLIGMGAILLDGVVLGDECLVAAGSLLPPGKTYPARSLIVGSPAVVKAEVTDEEAAWILDSAEHYMDLARRHRG